MSFVAEAPPTKYGDRDLSALWADHNFPLEALPSRPGRRFQVVYRGRKGRGPGPDYLDAIIAIETGELLQGDVELHQRASDFVRDGHHLDRAYNGVILHVVLWDDSVVGGTALESGREVPIVALGPWLEQSSAVE